MSVYTCPYCKDTGTLVDRRRIYGERSYFTNCGCKPREGIDDVIAEQGAAQDRADLLMIEAGRQENWRDHVADEH